MRKSREPTATGHLFGHRTPIAMENFGLRAGTPLAQCRAKVAEAGVFLGIIGHEYGSCPPDNSDVSYTRAEYHEALALGLPRLMFVLPVPDGVTLDKRQALFRETVLADGLAVVKEVGPDECALLTAVGLAHLAKPEEKTAGAKLPPRPEVIGRRAEIDRIVAELTASRPRPMVILGHAGMGKTTVSRAVLHEPKVRERFGDRRFFAELATADDPEKLRIAVILALDLDPRGVKFDGALAFLAQSAPALLMLDNLETVLANPATLPEVEEDLLRLAQMEGLALAGSCRGRDKPGGPDWLNLDPLARLSPADSLRLFRRWASNVADSDPHLAGLLDALGGLPLALELMGRQPGGETGLTLIWREWQRLGAELLRRPGTPREGGRLDSLFASLSFSTARLGREGTRLFALLGRTPAGIAIDDIATLLGDDAAEAMRQLRGSGLTEHPSGRVDLLPPVRDHARRAHPPADDDTTWYRHYLALIRDLGPRPAREGGAEGVVRLAPELPNIEAAIDEAIVARDLAPALEAQSGYALSNAVRFTGLGSGRSLVVLAAACATAGDARSEALCLDGLGDIALARSDHDAARSHYEAALLLYRRVGAVLGEANCIKSLGDIALRRSDHDAARSRYEEALPLFRRVGDVVGEANCISAIGDIAKSEGDHGSAKDRYETALGMYERVHQLANYALCHERLATVTTGAERAGHVTAAKETWLSIKLPERAARVEERFR